MTNSSYARRAATVVLASMILANPAAAADLPEATGDVILTVDGDISATNDDGKALFDLEMLQAMETRTFVTETIWTEGAITFEGVGLETLLGALGVESGTLTATAINDYAVEIPASDAGPDGPIIAFHVNGAPMSVREKGPLWVVYPFDDNTAYQTEQIYSRSIWQLDRITVSE